VDKLQTVVKSVGYLSKDVMFMPVSGLTGENLKTRIDRVVAPWYTYVSLLSVSLARSVWRGLTPRSGPSLLEYLDSIKAPERSGGGLLRMIVLDKIKEGGSVLIIGKACVARRLCPSLGRAV
jgi:peptide chain release factor subunit 3